MRANFKAAYESMCAVYKYTLLTACN